MSQHDMVIDNQAGASFRADLNNALPALASNSSGTSAPATPYAYQFWADTSAGLLKMRNGANTAWISIGLLGVPNFGHMMPGTVVYHAKNAAPSGCLKANGAAVSRTTYADLFAEIGITFGAGDGSTTFNLPDLRGEWIRGWDDSRGIDVSRVFGSFQAEMIGPHNHPIRASVSGYTGGNPAVLYAGGDNNGNSQVAGGGATYGVQNNSGTENRTRNIALLACIKY